MRWSISSRRRYHVISSCDALEGRTPSTRTVSFCARGRSNSARAAARVSISCRLASPVLRCLQSTPTWPSSQSRPTPKARSGTARQQSSAIKKGPGWHAHRGLGLMSASAGSSSSNGSYERGKIRRHTRSCLGSRGWRSLLGLQLSARQSTHSLPHGRRASPTARCASSSGCCSGCSDWSKK